MHIRGPGSVKPPKYTPKWLFLGHFWPDFCQIWNFKAHNATWEGCGIVWDSVPVAWNHLGPTWTPPGAPESPRPGFFGLGAFWGVPMWNPPCFVWFCRNFNKIPPFLYILRSQEPHWPKKGTKKGPIFVNLIAAKMNPDLTPCHI